MRKAVVRTLQKFVLALGALSLLAGAPPAQAALDPVKVMLDRVNAARAAAGLSRVVVDPTLSQAAQDHTKHMADLGKLNHDGFPDRLRRFGGSMVENVASGTMDPSQTLQRWMKSESHRKNLLQPGVTVAGIGVQGGYWTLIMGASTGGGPSFTSRTSLKKRFDTFTTVTRNSTSPRSIGAKPRAPGELMPGVYIPPGAGTSKKTVRYSGAQTLSSLSQ